MRADLFFLNDEHTHTSASSSHGPKPNNSHGAQPEQQHGAPSHYNSSTNNDKCWYHQIQAKKQS
jgi:hypothetical protein